MAVGVRGRASVVFIQIRLFAKRARTRVAVVRRGVFRVVVLVPQSED